MVDTIKFSQMTDGGDIDNNKKTPGLKSGANVLFNNPWTFLPPGDTAARPTPSAEVNFRLRFNTEVQLYEYYDSVLMMWTQLQESAFTQGPFIIYQADASIPDGQNLGALVSGILKQTVTLGVATLDIALNGTDYWKPGDALTRTQAPTVGNDVTNKTYVDAQVAGSVISVQGTANQVLVNATSGTPQTGALTLTTPQDIGLTSSPTFSNLQLSGGLIVGADGTTVFEMVNTALSVNHIRTTSQVTGVNPSLSAQGTDTNIGISLIGKGTGAISLISGALTQPLLIYSGTSNQHITRFNMANTAQDRSVTWQDANGTVAFLSDVPSVTPAALTKTDDTNVTLTLGGTPATALLQAVSLTLGWTGLLAGTRGGTGVNNGANTATFAGNLNFANSFQTIGNFSVIQRYTAGTDVTFPTTGTLATTSQIPTGAELTKTDDTNVTLTLGGSPATALVNAASLTLGWTGVLSIARGGNGVGSVTTSPTASAWAGWDANSNFSANNFIAGYATTATAAGNTTLTVGSAASQFFTGSSTQTVTLPVASTLVIGHHFYVVNNSSGNVTINSSGGNAIQVMAAGTTCNLTCILNSGTSAASWYAEYAFQSGSSSGTVNSGSINQLAWYAANGTAVSGLATGNNGVLITSAGGVPSISSTLPAAVQSNITATGAVTGTSFNTITGVAAQSDQETATSIVTVVTPGRQQYHPSAAKVWCFWTSITTTTILASYNVTSLTDGGTGLTTVNFTTSFSSANYAVQFKCDDGSANTTLPVLNTWATGSVLCAAKNNSGTNTDMSKQSMEAFGDQ